MTSFLSHRVSGAFVASALIACGGNADGTKYLLLVRLMGTGSGTVTSSQRVGINCGSACSASLDVRSSVTLTAKPAAGSDFAGWSESCSGAGACTIAMDAAKAVTARFSLSRIVFESKRKLDGTDATDYTSNIWRVNSDGTGVAPLTTAADYGASSFAPQWSPDGAKVVFFSPRKLDGTDAPNVSQTRNIWRVNADGTGLTPLTRATASGADSFAPRWSPDSDKIVFYSRRKLDGTNAPNLNFTSNIWQANADGTGLAPLTTATARGAGSFGPQWSHDGAQIVFYSSRSLDRTDAPNLNQTLNIWRVNADGTGLAPLTTATAYGADGFGPQWSPVGAEVVFYSRRQLDGSDAPNANYTSNIWRVNADGTGLAPLTTASARGADSHSPQWSPDGTQVAFASSRALIGVDAPNYTFNVWLVNANGRGLAPLTTANARGADSYSPQWSPEGAKIVFESRRNVDWPDLPNPNGTINIWRANADGTRLAALTNATARGADSYSPTFSP